MQWSELLPLVLVLALLLIPVGLYILITYNALGQERERLLALAANARAARQKRQGMGRDLSKHVGHAQHHERSVARFGSRRGRGAGRLASDIANGWPMVVSTHATTQAMTANADSRQAELQAREALHTSAESYNARIRQFPDCVIAGWFGFKPWRFRQRRKPFRRSPRRQR